MPTGILLRARISPALAVIAATGFSVLNLGVASGAEDSRRLVAEETHMGVLVRISAYIPRGVGPPSAFRQAFDRIANVARTFSSFREDSELRRIEQAAWRQPTPVSREFARLLGHALRLAQQTGGAFDPTLGTVTRLLRAEGWRREGPPVIALREARSRTGWTHVRLDPSSLEVSIDCPGLQFDLGGIAKGYAADEALAALQRVGVSRAMVAVAGDIAVGDPPPAADGWRIALDAIGPPGSVEHEVTLSNSGVSTSGSRDRYYLANGVRCSHIFPNSASGCADPTLAVSVVAPSALEADGLATALISLGEKGSEGILSGRRDVSVYWSSFDSREATGIGEPPGP